MDLNWKAGIVILGVFLAAVLPALNAASGTTLLDIPFLTALVIILGLAAGYLVIDKGEEIKLGIAAIILAVVLGSVSFATVPVVGGWLVAALQGLTVYVGSIAILVALKILKDTLD